MRAIDLKRFRALPLFANASDEVFHQLTIEAHVQRCPAGTLLLREGAAADFLYVLLDGQVELHGTWNGQETILALVRPVSTFILAAVVLEADALMSARTLERSEVLLIPGTTVRSAVKMDAQFAAAVSRDLAGGFRTMVRAVKNQKLRSGVERLANHLITLHESEPPVAPNKVMLRQEKRVLASLLGMTPENLSRAFAALRDYGVTVDGSLVTLSNLGALGALAKPDPLIDNHAPRTLTVPTSADAEIWANEASHAKRSRRRRA